MSDIKKYLKNITYRRTPYWTEDEYEDAKRRVENSEAVDVKFGRKIVRTHYHIEDGVRQTRESIEELFDHENQAAHRDAVRRVAWILAVKPHKDAELRWRTGDFEAVSDSELTVVYIHDDKLWWILSDNVTRPSRSLNTTYGRALAFVFGLIDELVWPDESEDAS